MILGEFKSVKDRTVDEVSLCYVSTLDLTWIPERRQSDWKNSAQVLFNDPTRRFFFGMTMEYTTVRFWLFSRSHVLVSHDLDLEAVSRLPKSMIPTPN